MRPPPEARLRPRFGNRPLREAEEAERQATRPFVGRIRQADGGISSFYLAHDQKLSGGGPEAFW
jgi:hypothetical protein